MCLLSLDSPDQTPVAFPRCVRTRSLPLCPSVPRLLQGTCVVGSLWWLGRLWGHQGALGQHSSALWKLEFWAGPARPLPSPALLFPVPSWLPGPSCACICSGVTVPLAQSQAVPGRVLCPTRQSPRTAGDSTCWGQELGRVQVTVEEVAAGGPGGRRGALLGKPVCCSGEGGVRDQEQTAVRAGPLRLLLRP